MLLSVLYSQSLDGGQVAERFGTDVLDVIVMQVPGKTAHQLFIRRRSERARVGQGRGDSGRGGQRLALGGRTRSGPPSVSGERPCPGTALASPE